MSIGSAARAVAAVKCAMDAAYGSCPDLLTLRPRLLRTQTRAITRRAAVRIVACSWPAASSGATAQAQPLASTTQGLLDGQRFRGTVGAMGKETPYNHDSIVFADGYFVSTDCVQCGFERAPHSARRDGDVIHFDAVTTSPTHGTMTWTGSIRGDAARAKYRWVRERWFWTRRGEYCFKGRRDGAAR